MNKKFINILFYTWIVVIFAVSSIPRIKIPGPPFELKDKLAHWSQYLVLGVLFRLREHKTCSARKFWPFGILLGGVTELQQLFIPGRSCEFTDFMFNLLGFVTPLVLPLSQNRRQDVLAHK